MMRTRIAAATTTDRAIAQSRAVPQRTASSSAIAAAEVAAAAMLGPVISLLLQTLDVRDDVPDVRLAQLGIRGHRLRLADSAATLGDGLVHLLVVHVLEPAAALGPIAGLVLQLLALRAVAGPTVAMALRAVLLVDLGARLGVALALGERAGRHRDHEGTGEHRHRYTGSHHRSPPRSMIRHRLMRGVVLSTLYSSLFFR